MDACVVAEVYQCLTKDNLEQLEEIYHQNIVFEDPAHKISGLPDLLTYFQLMYANVDYCQFNFKEIHQATAETGFLIWVMELRHPKLQKGESIFVHGTSVIKFQDNKVIYHRDYFDLGEMLYENLPIFGGLVKKIKRRLGQ